MSYFSDVLDYHFPNLRGQGQYLDTPYPRNSQTDLRKSATWVSVGGFEYLLYKTTPELYAIINKIAALRNNGKFKHYKIGADGKPKEVLNSDFIDRINSPNVLQSRDEWLANRTINQLIYGNDYTYALKASRLSEVPSALWNLMPNKIIINRTGKIWRQTDISKIITNYELINDGTNVNDFFETNEIFHNKRTNPEDPLVGLSPLIALQMPLSNIRLAYGFRNVIMDEHGALGFITSDNKDAMGAIPMKPEDKLDIEKQYSKTHGIRKGQAKIKIFTTPTKWESTSYKTKDLMLFEEIDANKKALLDAYGINENVFAGSKSTFNNVLEGLKSTYQDCVIPESDKDCVGLSKLFGLIEKGEFIDQDFSHVECLQDNQAEKSLTLQRKADAYTKLKTTGDFDNNRLQEIFNF